MQRVGAATALTAGALPEFVQRLGAAGWLRYCVPEAHGGALPALDSRALVILRETLAYHSPLADFAFAMQGLGSGAITLAGTSAQQAAYLETCAEDDEIALRMDAGRRALMLQFLLVNMFPIVLLIIPLFIIMKNLGLLDTHLGLILAHSTFSIPFATWMMISYFDAIPRSLDEAAMVDGCTPMGAMVRVVLPLTLPGIKTTHHARMIHLRRRMHLAFKARQRRRITTKRWCQHLHRHLTPEMPVLHPPHRAKASTPDLPAKRQLREQPHQRLRRHLRLPRALHHCLRLLLHQCQPQKSRLTPGEGVF